MSGRQSWTAVAIILGLLVVAQPVVGSQDTKVVDALEKCVGRYFTLLEAKDPSLTTFFEKIASEDFQCRRGETLYDKNAWLAYIDN